MGRPKVGSVFGVWVFLLLVPVFGVVLNVLLGGYGHLWMGERGS